LNFVKRNGLTTEEGYPYVIYNLYHYSKEYKVLNV